MNERVVLVDSDMGDCDIERRVCERAGLEFYDARGQASDDAGLLFDNPDAILVQYQVVDHELISRMPNLKAVATYGVGTDHIDADTCRSLGIQIIPVPDYCIDEVADHTLALVLAALRGIVPLSLEVRAGRWPGTREFGPLRTLRDSTYSIIGFGNIGRAVYKRAAAFGADLRVHDPYAQSRWLDEYGARSVPIEEAFESNVVSVHVPLTTSTIHMVTGVLLDRMPSGGVFVNVSRGEVVCEEDLALRVEAGKLFAALDVLSHEPPEVENALAIARGCIITPHAGWYSNTAEHRLRQQAASSLTEFLSTSRESRELRGIK